MKYIIFLVALIIFNANFENVDAKGGCHSYGHSCLGGHGKRSAPPPYGPDLWFQHIFKPKNEFPPNDYHVIEERDIDDFPKGFPDTMKFVDDKEN
ncbi:uncharacterized protein NPIL_627151 [Nephila pilipes]|uniref:Spider venom protein n=1 Tax=Nephila pilipes TaxID=299642 RepID=A0A8X6R4C7_NEPPI|nr:uncharacterized protein NPIL_627151 [Nephila pilipes]